MFTTDNATATATRTRAEQAQAHHVSSGNLRALGFQEEIGEPDARSRCRAATALRSSLSLDQILGGVRPALQRVVLAVMTLADRAAVQLDHARVVRLDRDSEHQAGLARSWLDVGTSVTHGVPHCA